MDDHIINGKQTVFVGLSGGVDSSVAALRLLQQGYNVVGVFIKVWHPNWLTCNWEAERLDAMRAAAHLGIPFLTCNAEKEYEAEVADYFIKSYQQGLTPNPDVMCNKAVKFGAFLRFAQEHGADFVATGHYARKTVSQDGLWQLLRGVDDTKDQSYFLWTLAQEQLAQTLFPIGDTRKSDIRAEAAAAGLLTAEKKDSQGVCFLGHIDIPEFLSHYIDLKEGSVLNARGEQIGIHKGAFVYTIGQRHGFVITDKTALRVPHYVIAKDVIANTITVSTTEPKIHAEGLLNLHEVNWITGMPVTTERLSAEFRYRQIPVSVQLTNTSKSSVSLTMLQTADQPTSGQSCVLYDGDVCMGGGIIE